MKNSATRPQRLDVSELDLAVEQALARVAQANEMSEEDCLKVSGGLIASTPGYFPRDPIL